MAPGLRTNVQGRTRGANRGEQHDDFEGLPIRQWRRERHNIALPLQEEQPKQNDKWAVELPHGMPKDSHLLPQHSQDLLRALRSGRFYKRPAPDDEEADQDNVADKPEKKEEEEANVRAFAAPIWRPIPRNAEGPEISHLAKRRKGTVVLPSKAALLQSGLPTITKAKVRRLDAAGNSYIQDVTLTDGQQVDGEIISTSVVTAPVAMNTTSGDLSTQTTPVKRKPVAQRKKIKGPGRGRKKKLPLPASTRPDANNSGDGTTTEGVASAAESNGTKLESENPSNHDSPMVDDDEGDDDEGDDNEGGDDEHDQEQEMKDAPAIDQAPTQQRPEENFSHSSVVLEPINAFSLPSLAPPHTQSRVEGSPLKNVVMASPTEPKQVMAPLGSPLVSQPQDAPAPTAHSLVQAPPLKEAGSNSPELALAPTTSMFGISIPEDNTQNTPAQLAVQFERSVDVAPIKEQKPSTDTKSEQEPLTTEDLAMIVESAPQEVEGKLVNEDTKMDESAPVQDSALSIPNESVPDHGEHSGGPAEAPVQGTENPESVTESAAEPKTDVASEAKTEPEPELIQEQGQSKEQEAGQSQMLSPEQEAQLEAQKEPQAAPGNAGSAEHEPSPISVDPPTIPSQLAVEHVVETKPEEEPESVAVTDTEADYTVPASAATEGDDGDDLLGKLMGSLEDETSAPAVEEASKYEPPSKDEPPEDEKITNASKDAGGDKGDAEKKAE